MDFYQAKPYGNEIEGRSTVVSTDVRDTIEWIMPQLVRIFTSGEDVVEFQPETGNDVEAAKLATEYVNFIWNRDNEGFLNFYSWFKDGLLSKNGIVKIWWDDTPVQKRERYTGLDDNAFALLVSPDDVTVAEHTERQEQVIIPGPDGQPHPQEITVHDVVITREMKGGKVCVRPLPPEEFLLSRDARNITDARFVGHRRRRPISDLIEEGFDRDVLDKLGSDEVSVARDAEEVKRNTVENFSAGTTASTNQAMRELWVTEGYLRVDVDGDGIAEMRKVVVAGSTYKVLSNEAWDMDRPFATLTPVIMPHRFWGLAVADLIKDIQLIKSTIFRQYLDNLYLANNQREQVIESQIVDPSEVLSSAPGRKIRVKSGPAIFPIETPQVGAQALEGLQYLDQLIENRTGVSDRTQGLDYDQLNQTATGQRIQMTAAQAKIELIARVFAETGVKDAFRMILKLITRYQDKPRMIRLDQDWVSMDPSSWNADMDMTTRVALGLGDRDQQLQHGMMLSAMQEKALPLGFISPKNLMETANMIVNAMGQKGAERFFTVPQGPQAQAPIPPPPPPNQGDNPQVEVAKIEAKGKVDMQIAQMKAQFDAQSQAQQAQAKATTDQHLNEIEAQRSQLQLQNDAALEKLKLDANSQLAVLKMQLEAKSAEELAHIHARAQVEAARVAKGVSDGSIFVAGETDAERLGSSIAGLAQRLDAHAMAVNQQIAQQSANQDAHTQHLAALTQAVSKLADNHAQAQAQQNMHNAQVMGALTAEKELVRDKNGRAQGVRVKANGAMH